MREDGKHMGSYNIFMKLIISILLLPVISFSQDAKTLVVHGDTLWYKNLTLNDSLQLTRTNNIVQSFTNKTFSTGCAWTGNSIADAYINGASAWNSKQSAITTGTTAQYLLGDLSLATFPTTTASFTNSTNKNFVTDAQSTVVGNTSGTNTGDNAVNSNYNSLVSNATHTGDATGATALTVVKINGTSLAGLATGILKNTTSTGVPSIAVQADITALLGAGSITNTMLANAAVANLSGTNTGDNSANSTYANDFRTANFIAGTNYLAPNGSAASLTSFPTFNQSTTGSAATLTTSRTIGITGDVTYTSPSFNGSGNVTSTATVNSVTGKLTSYNAISTVGNGVPSLVATVDLTAQGANIGATTLYSVPASGAGLYRVTLYISITRAATTSSTMPSTAITYTDAESSAIHTTTTTATAAGNSITASFAQSSYILYAKASTNIQYTLASFATSGATSMQFNLHVKCEAL